MQIIHSLFTSLPNAKLLDRSKLKAFAEGKKDGFEMMISLLNRVENIVGKGEMLVTSIFSFFNKVFLSPLPQGR